MNPLVQQEAVLMYALFYAFALLLSVRGLYNGLNIVVIGTSTIECYHY